MVQHNFNAQLILELQQEWSLIQKKNKKNYLYITMEKKTKTFTTIWADKMK